jgi:hypothetical protein
VTQRHALILLLGITAAWAFSGRTVTSLSLNMVCHNGVRHHAKLPGKTVPVCNTHLLDFFEQRQELSRFGGVVTVSFQLRDYRTLPGYVFFSEHHMCLCFLQVVVQHLANLSCLKDFWDGANLKGAGEPSRHMGWAWSKISNPCDLTYVNPLHAGQW